MHNTQKIIIIFFLLVLTSSCTSNINSKDDNIGLNTEETMNDNNKENIDKVDDLESDSITENVKDTELETIESFYSKYNQEGTYIVDIMDLGSNLIIITDNNDCILENIDQNKTVEIQGSRILREGFLNINDGKMSMCLHDHIIIFELADLELILEQEYEEAEIKDIRMSPNMSQIVYIDSENNIYVSNIDNTKAEQLKIDYDDDDSIKIMNPIFLDNNILLIELIGDYPIGTNLIKYNIATGVQQYLHIDDIILGHTSYLDGGSDFAVLSNEFTSIVIDVNKFELNTQIQLSEKVEFIPELNHMQDKLLYVDNEDHIIVMSLKSGIKEIVDENWNGDFISWTYKDDYIFGNNNRNGEKSFLYYPVEN